MDLSLSSYCQLQQQRYSVRAFTDELVPLPIIDDIFRAAQRAPSNCNSQPWQVWLLRGEKCEQLRRQLLAEIGKGEFYPQDFVSTETFDGVYRQRQIACAQALYGAMGIARNDKPARLAAMLRNYAFFDAPQVAFIGMDKSFGYNNALDVGMFVQSLVTAMQLAGLGSCVQGALSHHSPIVRKFLNMDESIGILTGISFGYEAEAAANKARTDRAPVEDYLTIVE